MPQALTREQEKFIHGILDDFLDLPSEEKALREEMAAIQLALEEKPLPATHRYAWLQNCYREPTAYFQRLEDQNPDITIGLVQETILAYLSDVFAKTAQPGTDLTCWGWDPKPKDGNFSIPFLSQPARFDSEDPWQLPVCSELLYSLELQQSREDHKIIIKIHIDLPNFPPLEDDWIVFPLSVKTDEEQDRFVYSQHLKIQKDAEIRVSDQLLRYLSNKQIISGEERREAWKGGPRHLITYRYYFNAVLNGKIFIRKLFLTPTQAAILVEPAIIGLLQAGKCELEQATDLWPSELAVCINPYYSQNMHQNQMRFQDVKGLSHAESSILNLPGVIYLQRKRKINYFQARTIALSAAAIFKSERCLQMILMDKPPFEKVRRLSAKKAALFANDYYAGEFANNRLSLAELHHWTDAELKKLLLPPLIELQRKGLLSRSAAKSMPFNVCQLLEDEAFLDLVLQGEVSISFLQTLSSRHVATLSRPDIRSLVLNGKMKIEAVLWLSKHQKAALSKKAIFDLFNADKLSLADLNRLPLVFAKVLDNNPCLQGLFMQDILTLQDCLYCLAHDEPADQPFIELGLQFAGRLIGFLKDKPYSFQSGVKDSITLLQQDLEEILKPQALHLRKPLSDQTLKVFFRFLHRYFILELAEQQNIDSFYTRFLNEIRSASEDLFEERGLDVNADYLQTFRRLRDIAFEKAVFVKSDYRPRFNPSTVPPLSFLFMPGGLIQAFRQIDSFCQVLLQAESLATAFKMGSPDVYSQPRYSSSPTP